MVGVQVERASGVRVPVSDADDTRRQVRKRPRMRAKRWERAGMRAGGFGGWDAGCCVLWLRAIMLPALGLACSAELLSEVLKARRDIVWLLASRN